jgi:catechol 2,3-dioxygenase-like lactoylglutathione lyase family enzyme
VHLLGPRQARPGVKVRPPGVKMDDTGRLDHIAFEATGFEAMRQHLRAKGVEFRENIVPRSGAAQLFLFDPDGVGVELNFASPTS